MGSIGVKGFRVLGLRYWGDIKVILGLYGDNGKENGNYYTLNPKP